MLASCSGDQFPARAQMARFPKQREGRLRVSIFFKPSAMALAQGCQREIAFIRCLQSCSRSQSACRVSGTSNAHLRLDRCAAFQSTDSPWQAPPTGGWQDSSTYGYPPSITTLSWVCAFSGVGTEYVHSVVSDLSDFSTQFSTAVSDTFGVSWNWASGNCFSGSYNQPTIYTDLTGVDFSGVDLSFSTTTSASTYGPIRLGLVNYDCVNGWNKSGGLVIYRSLAKNTTGVQQVYYIGRYRGTIGAYSSPKVTTGVTTTTAIIDLISVGLIEPNQVIGTGADIDLPFPTSTAYPETELGNSVLNIDFYFAVIGKNPPADYFKTYTAVTT